MRQMVMRTALNERDHVRLAVQDAGGGFDARAAERLFEALYTTKNDPMGMGLPISRAIIERHHGHL